MSWNYNFHCRIDKLKGKWRESSLNLVVILIEMKLLTGRQKILAEAEGCFSPFMGTFARWCSWCKDGIGQLFTTPTAKEQLSHTVCLNWSIIIYDITLPDNPFPTWQNTMANWVSLKHLLNNVMHKVRALIKRFDDIV